MVKIDNLGTDYCVLEREAEIFEVEDNTEEEVHSENIVVEMVSAWEEESSRLDGGSLEGCA